MSQTPGKKDNDEAKLSPKGQRKISNVMLAGVLVVIAAVLIFVISSAVLNGA